MAKKEQDKNTQNPQEIMKAVLKPLGDAIDALAKGQTANQKAIKALAQQKQEPLIPKELTDVLQKTIPGIIDGIFKALTTPDTTPEKAKQGIFSEAMSKAFEKATIKRWDTEGSILEETLKGIQLDNQRKHRVLPDEY